MGIVAAVDVNDRYIHPNDRFSLGVDDFSRDGYVGREMEIVLVLGLHFAAEPKAAGKPVLASTEPGCGRL